MNAKEIRQRLSKLADPAIAEHSLQFFKAGAGEYAEGDLFHGIRVPELRAQARKCQPVSLTEIKKLLKSQFHEERLLALFLLVHSYKLGDEKQKSTIYELYLDHTEYVNHWDLVDSSAYWIVGEFLRTRGRDKLEELARSASLWERRIAIIATLNFIRHGEFADTLSVAKILIDDREPLIHKAVGWMLREVGKRDIEVEKTFLADHYQMMPRTMLRYAIEKFPKEIRQQYLRGEV